MNILSIMINHVNDVPIDDYVIYDFDGTCFPGKVTMKHTTVWPTSHCANTHSITDLEDAGSSGKALCKYSYALISHNCMNSNSWKCKLHGDQGARSTVLLGS